MKKLLVCVLAVVLCLGLCACDVDAILDGVGQILDGNEGESHRTEDAVNQMIPAGDSDSVITWMPQDGDNAYIMVDEDGNVISNDTAYEVEIIDGMIYINGEKVGSVEDMGDGSFSYVIVDGEEAE